MLTDEYEELYTYYVRADDGNTALYIIVNGAMPEYFAWEGADNAAFAELTALIEAAGPTDYTCSFIDTEALFDYTYTVRNGKAYFEKRKYIINKKNAAK